MDSNRTPTLVWVVKEVPVLLKRTSTARPPVVVDGTASALETRRQEDTRSPFWDEDE